MPRAHPFKFDRFALMQLLVEIVGHMPPQQGYFWIATADSASRSRANYFERCCKANPNLFLGQTENVKTLTAARARPEILRLKSIREREKAGQDWEPLLAYYEYSQLDHPPTAEELDNIPEMRRNLDVIIAGEAGVMREAEGMRDTGVSSEARRVIECAMTSGHSTLDGVCDTDYTLETGEEEGGPCSSSGVMYGMRTPPSGRSKRSSQSSESSTSSSSTSQGRKRQKRASSKDTWTTPTLEDDARDLLRLLRLQIQQQLTQQLAPMKDDHEEDNDDDDDVDVV